jgi:hypothetical protein
VGVGDEPNETVDGDVGYADSADVGADVVSW